MQAAGGPALVCAALEPIAHHLYTSRSWALGAPAGSTPAAWAELARALGVDGQHLARLDQVHGNAVVTRLAGDQKPVPDHEAADILVSNDPALALSVRAADCVPILIADRRTGAVAAAHAGWRGLAVRVPEVTVEALGRQFGSRPGDLIAAIGPSISACCYEVGADVVERFEEAGFPERQRTRWLHESPQPSDRNPSWEGVPRERRDHHWYFDAWASARDQLEAAGVPVAQIYVAELCTASHPEALCSYRRDGRGAGRMAAAIRAKQP